MSRRSTGGRRARRPEQSIIPTVMPFPLRGWPGVVRRLVEAGRTGRNLRRVSSGVGYQIEAVPIIVLGARRAGVDVLLRDLRGRCGAAALVNAERRLFGGGRNAARGRRRLGGRGAVTTARRTASPPVTVRSRRTAVEPSTAAGGATPGASPEHALAHVARIVAARLTSDPASRYTARLLMLALWQAVACSPRDIPTPVGHLRFLVDESDAGRAVGSPNIGISLRRADDRADRWCWCSGRNRGAMAPVVAGPLLLATS